MAKRREGEPRRAIYLLPNLFTLAALLAGFYAIMRAASGDFTDAGWAIVLAAALDSLDGRVARLINAESDFGAQFDSLADVISFGAAPAAVAISWGLEPMGRVGFAVGFFFCAAAAVRLARFNTNLGSNGGESSSFTGLPCPVAGVIVAVTVLVLGDDRTLGNAFLLAALMGLLGFSMVSEIGYTSFKDLELRARVRTPVQIMGALVAVSLFALALIEFGARVILILALIYVGYGYLAAGRNLLREYRTFKGGPAKFARKKYDAWITRGEDSSKQSD